MPKKHDPTRDEMARLAAEQKLGEPEVIESQQEFPIGEVRATKPHKTDAGWHFEIERRGVIGEFEAHAVSGPYPTKKAADAARKEI